MESKTVAERNGIPTAVKTPPTLAHRCVLYQHCGHVLLLVQRPGRRQPLYRALGDPGIDEGSRSGDHSGTGSREVSRCQATRHLRQWPTVHCERLQGIHPNLWDDACENVAVLSAIEWENRTLAQVHQNGVHPSRSAIVLGRCTADRGIVGEPLQFGSPSQRDWLPRALGQTRRTGRSNLCGTRSQTRRSSSVATTAPQPQNDGHWTGTQCHSRLTVPGEAEAGSAGKQPCQGIIWWAHRHDGNGARHPTITPRPTSSDDRPQCLENPTNLKATCLHLRKPGGSPFHVEPGQFVQFRDFRFSG